MQKMFCDRCGTEVSEKNVSSLETTRLKGKYVPMGHRPDEGLVLDLCDSCWVAFLKWKADAPNGGKASAEQPTGEMRSSVKGSSGALSIELLEARE